MTASFDLDRTRLMFPRLAGLYGKGEGLSYALLRAGFGAVILTHGLPKLLGTAHGTMANARAGAVRMIETSLGLPFAPELGVLITALETVGAVAIALGLFTRPIAAIFVLQMIAICAALRATFPWIDRGWEYPLVLGLIALLIAFRGGGDWSLDRLLTREM